MDALSGNKVVSARTLRGSLTLEVLIALALLVTTLTGVTLMAFSGNYLARDTALSSGSIYQNSSYLEKMTARIKAYWYDVRESGFPEGTFIEKNISRCMKNVRIETLQTLEKGRAYTAHLETFVGSEDEARALDYTCDPFPLSSSFSSLESRSTLTLTDATTTAIAIRTIDDKRYAILTSSSNIPTTPDFYIIDITNTNAPVLVASLDTGSGIHDMAVSGRHAYVLTKDNTKQLAVIDFAELTHPTIVATRSLPNITSTCTPSTKICLAGTSIFYYDGLIYIGTRYIAFGTNSTHNNEFHIYCVSDTRYSSCAPANPLWLGSLNINHNINDITVAGSFAYLATSDNTGELMIVDISDPTHLTHPDATKMKFDIKTTGNGASTEDATSVFVLGTHTYLGRARVNGTTERDWYILDTTNKTAITVIGSLKLASTPNTYISAIIVHDGRAFVSSTDSTKNIRVISVDIPSAPVEYITCKNTDPKKTFALAYAHQTLFAGQLNRFQILTDATPSCP